MMKRSFGESLKRSDISSCMNATVSPPRQEEAVVWDAGLQAWLMCTMAGTSSSQSFSYTGYHHLSVSGGSENLPPEGSGLRLQPTKPNSCTQRSSSGMTPRGSTPGDCGNWQTPT